MSVGLYMDVHVRRSVTTGLKMRGVNVLTAQEDGTAEWDDAELLRCAGTLGRILFTQDDDFLVEVARLQREGKSFPTVVYAHQLNATCGSAWIPLN